MIRKLWPGLAATAAAAVFGILRLHDLPPMVASHWGVHGEVNGYMSRTALVMLMPAIGLVVAAVLAFAPRLDPRYRNFPLHAGSYWLVANAVLAFLAGTHVLIVGYNLGWPINLTRIMGIGSGLLFIILGNVMTRVRPNWIFGIRTPWTLSSDLAWRQTHRLGGYLFVVSGIAVIATGVLWPASTFAVLLTGSLLSAGIAIVWSYFAWRRDPAVQRSPS
jgi:uncharacterized membrane protein